MARLLFLIQVSRPISWPILPVVYVMGLRASGAAMSWQATVQIVLLAFPMNLVGCGLNDIYDYESDRRSHRKRLIGGAVVHDQDRGLVWLACLVAAPVILAGALLTGSVANIVVTACHLLVALAYSVPPVRLKERPPLDSLANGLGYFLLPLAMGYSLGGRLTTISLKYYLLALCVSGIHALSTAADYEVDRAAGHHTLAVAYGRRAAAVVALMPFLVALAVGDFQGLAVRIYLGACAVATAAAVAVPRGRVITLACYVIYAGFLVAALFYLYGW